MILRLKLFLILFFYCYFSMRRRFFATVLGISYAIFLVIFGAIVFIGDAVVSQYPLSQVNTHCIRIDLDTLYITNIDLHRINRFIVYCAIYYCSAFRCFRALTYQRCELNRFFDMKLNAEKTNY